jgi:hypothetical protein
MWATQKGGESMEVIQEEKNDVNQMAAFSCCWPPGTLSLQWPDGEN